MLASPYWNRVSQIPPFLVLVLPRGQACNLLLLNHVLFCWTLKLKWLTQEWKRMVYVILSPEQNPDQIICLCFLSNSQVTFFSHSSVLWVSDIFLVTLICLHWQEKLPVANDQWCVGASLHQCTLCPAFLHSVKLVTWNWPWRNYLLHEK